MNKIYFVSTLIKPQHGGVTRSMLNRAKIFKEKLDIDVTIIEMHKNNKLDSTRQYLINKDLLLESTKVVNMYQNLKSKSNKRYQNQNIFKKLFEKVRTKYYFNKYKSNSNIQVYKNKYGIIYLAIEKTENTRIFTVFRGKKIIRLNSFDEFKKYFLEFYLGNQKSTIIFESKSMYKAFAGLENVNYDKIFLVNSPHYTVSLGDNGIANEYNYLFNKLNTNINIIVLTKNQKQAIVDITNCNPNKIHVISPFVKTNFEIDVNNKDPFKIVVVSRLSFEKQINHMIEAMVHVQKYDSRIKLEIYGSGDQSLILQNLITEFGLEENVFLKGYTNEAINLLSKASLTLSCSLWEGFGITILESMSVGTPCISYNVNYGPKYLIDDGKNGFLVEKNNILELSNKIINYFSLDKKSFIDECLIKSSEFNEKKYLELWKNIIKIS